MVQPNEREQQVFKSLAEGEGEIIAGYLERVRVAIVADLVDGDATEADIAGAKLNRKLCKELQDRFQNSGIMKASTERFD